MRRYHLTATDSFQRYLDGILSSTDSTISDLASAHLGSIRERLASIVSRESHTLLRLLINSVDFAIKDLLEREGTSNSARADRILAGLDALLGEPDAQVALYDYHNHDKTVHDELTENIRRTLSSSSPAWSNSSSVNGFCMAIVEMVLDYFKRPPLTPNQKSGRAPLPEARMSVDHNHVAYESEFERGMQ